MSRVAFSSWAKPSQDLNCSGLFLLNHVRFFSDGCCFVPVVGLLHVEPFSHVFSKQTSCTKAVASICCIFL